MKLIKLSGRETAVLRAIDNLGTMGAEIAERTQISLPELADTLGAMCEVGYVEGYRAGSSIASMEPIPAAEVISARFEINPSYALELKKALQRH